MQASNFYAAVSPSEIALRREIRDYWIKDFVAEGVVKLPTIARYFGITEAEVVAIAAKATAWD